MSYELVDGKYVPYLKEPSLDNSEVYKTTVYAVPTGQRTNNQYTLTGFNAYRLYNKEIPVSKDYQYLNCNTDLNNPYVTRSEYGKSENVAILLAYAHTDQFAIVNEYGDGSFFIMWQRHETNNQLYLCDKKAYPDYDYNRYVKFDPDENQVHYWRRSGLGTQIDKKTAWLFISEEQYRLRLELGQKLEELEEKIKNGTASEAEKSVYEKLKANENNENITVEQLQSAKELVDAAFGKDVSLEKIDLEVAIIEAQKSANAIKDSIGVEPSYFVKPIDDAKAVLEKDDAIAADYNNAKNALQNALDLYSSLDYYYYWTVLQQAEKLGYVHDPSLTNIANVTTQNAIIDAAETLRTKTIEYLKGKRLATGTDLSIYIMNNSFDAVAVSATSNVYPSVLGWTISSNNNRFASETKTTLPVGEYLTSGYDGRYIFNTKGEYTSGIIFTQKVSFGASLSQNINIPAGKYKISCLTAAEDKTFLNVQVHGKTNRYFEKTNNSTTGFGLLESEEFEVKITDLSNDGYCEIVIKLEGNSVNGNKTWFRADDFHLIYLGDNTTIFGNDDPKIQDTNEEVQFEEGSYASAETRDLTVSTPGKPVWNTLCLPYDCPIPTGVEVKKLSNISVTPIENSMDDEIQLVFSTVENTMEAGVPYLVKITDEQNKKLTSQNVNVFNRLNPTIVMVEAEGKFYSYVVGMIGSFVQMYLLPNTYYVKSGTDQLWQVGEGSKVKLKGYRAFFEIEKILSLTDEFETISMAQIRMSMTTDDGEDITSIDGEPINRVPAGQMYDLTGRKISKPSKGLYIVNGKKYFNN